MTIQAKIIADSISPAGIRLTTMQLRYPKFVHGEFLTHRVFSRNASSSRAIPVARLIQDVLDDPAMPVVWGKNQKGMQARDELSEAERLEALSWWESARDEAVFHARKLAALGAHKQIVNRVIEPFMHVNVVVTATDYENFYALRRHPDAQPEIKALADAMWDAQQAATPVPLDPGQWHLPYVDEWDWLGPNPIPVEQAIKLSVARCARVSYLTHEGREPSVEQDLALYNRLVGSTPLHASPAEHQATPDENDEWACPELQGNLRGWRQYRKMLPNEFIAG